MAGRIKQLIDELVRLRTKNNPKVEHFVRAHLVLNGVDPDAYDLGSADDPVKIRALRSSQTSRPLASRRTENRTSAHQPDLYARALRVSSRALPHEHLR
jgi:hypothetical protein